MKRRTGLLLMLLLSALLLSLAVHASEDRGCSKTIYLSFDDGPGPYTDALLDVLAREGVKATFFVTGKVMDYPETLQRMHNEGHTIALHSFSHDYRKIYASEDAFFADLLEQERCIFELSGEHPTLLRFPGGSSNTVSDFNYGIMSRLCKAVGERGYRYVDWHVDSKDSVGCRSAEGVLRNMQKGCAEWGDCVILQHDIYRYSVDAVADFIAWGKAQGYVFEPMTEESPSAHHTIHN